MVGTNANLLVFNVCLLIVQFTATLQFVLSAPGLSKLIRCPYGVNPKMCASSSSSNQIPRTPQPSVFLNKLFTLPAPIVPRPATVQMGSIIGLATPFYFRDLFPESLLNGMSTPSYEQSPNKNKNKNYSDPTDEDSDSDLESDYESDSDSDSDDEQEEPDVHYDRLMKDFYDFETQQKWKKDPQAKKTENS